MIKDNVFLLNQQMKKTKLWYDYLIQVQILDRKTFQVANLTWELYSTIDYFRKQWKKLWLFDLVSFKNNVLYVKWWSWNWISIILEIIKLIYWGWATVINVSMP